MVQYNVPAVVGIIIGFGHGSGRRCQYRRACVQHDINSAVACGLPGDRMDPAAEGHGQGDAALSFHGPLESDLLLLQLNGAARRFLLRGCGIGSQGHRGDQHSHTGPSRQHPGKGFALVIHNMYQPFFQTLLLRKAGGKMRCGNGAQLQQQLAVSGPPRLVPAPAHGLVAGELTDPVQLPQQPPGRRVEPVEHRDRHSYPLDQKVTPPPVSQLVGEQGLQGLSLQGQAGQHHNGPQQSHQHGGDGIRAANQLGRASVWAGKGGVSCLGLLWGGTGTAQDAPGKPGIAYSPHRQYHSGSGQPHHPQKGFCGHRRCAGRYRLRRGASRLLWDGQGPRLLRCLHRLVEQAVGGGPGTQKAQQHQDPQDIDRPGRDLSF